MISKSVYLNNGTLFATGFNRVVHGGRGDYVEFTKDQIVIDLISRFGNDLSQPIDKYYFWLYPKGNLDVKVYLQLRTVKYADYKVGLYYVDPTFFMNFKDPEKLF